MVGKALGKRYPDVEITYLWVESRGDQITEGSLAEVGGKGLFTQSVDQAVLEKRADLAVHSLKDVPIDPSESLPGLALAAVCKRTLPNDCLVSADGHNSLTTLPQNAVVGTSSPRRAAQILALRPDIEVRLLRGNVDTRVKKVLSETGGYDAAVMAVAGLKRLGMREHADRSLSFEEMLPAACQGAIAIRCRGTDHVALTRCLPLNHAASSTAVHAEREVVSLLGGDCYSPIAVLAEPVPPSQTQAKRNADSHWFRLRIKACAADGSSVLAIDEQCKTAELRRLVKRVSKQLLDQGAGRLLAEARQSAILPAPTPSPVSMPQAQNPVFLKNNLP